MDERANLAKSIGHSMDTTNKYYHVRESDVSVAAAIKLNKKLLNHEKTLSVPTLISIPTKSVCIASKAPSTSKLLYTYTTETSDCSSLGEPSGISLHTVSTDKSLNVSDRTQCKRPLNETLQNSRTKKMKIDDNVDHVRSVIKKKIEGIVALSVENGTIDEFVTDRGLVSIQPLKSALDQYLLRSIPIKEIRDIVWLALGKFKTS